MFSAGEADYFFTNLRSVVSFVSNLDASQLSIEKEEYERYSLFCSVLVVWACFRVFVSGPRASS